MAKIELYKNKINNMPNIIGNVRAEVSSYATALTKLYSKILAIDSPVVDKAIASLSTATKIQEEQISGLNATQRQIDAFVLTVQVTDNRVASCIRELTKMYEAVYNYSHGVSTDIATDSLAEWLYKNWGDRFTYGYALYNSEDLENMSQEEFDKYVEQLLALDYNSLSVEDKTRVQAVSDYLSGVSINGNMSETDKKKVSQYNSLHEKIYTDECEKLSQLFSNAPSEFKDDVTYIKYVAYTSKGECRDIFFRFADQIQISEYYATHNNEPGNYFSSTDMSMHLNMKSIRDRNNAYGTFFHEAGHNIDMLMGMDETGNKEWYSSKVLANGSFHDLVYSDVEKVVTGLVNDYSNNEKNLSEEEKEIITDVLMGRKLDTELKQSKSDFAYRKVLEDITGAWKGKYSRQYQTGKETGILEKANAGMLSEVMNGMTNNSLMVDEYNYSKFWGIDHGTSGHPINWQDPNPNAGYVPQNYYYNADGSYTGSAETEYMAEYMRINMTQRTSEKNYVYNYLSNSWDAMENELSEYK